MKKILLFLLIANISFAQNSGVTADKFIIKPRIKTKKAKFITDKIYAQNSFFLGSDTTSQPEPFTITTNARFDGKFSLSGSFGQTGQYFKSGGASVPSWGYIDWSEISNKPTSVNSWIKMPVNGVVNNFGIGNGTTTQQPDGTNVLPFIFSAGQTRVGEYNQYGQIYGFTSLGINIGFVNVQSSMFQPSGQNYQFILGGKASFGFNSNMPSNQKNGNYFLDINKNSSSDISKLRFTKYEASGTTNVPKWQLQHGINDDFSIQKLNNNQSIDTTNSIYINAGRFNFGRSTGLNNSKFTFGGSATFADDVFFNQNTKSLQTLIDERKILFVDFGGVNVSNPASYSEYTYIFDTVNGVIYQYQHNPPPQQPEHELLEVGTFATASQLATKQNNLDGTGLVRMTGTTLSYDNNSYLSTSTASSTYFPRTSGVLYGLTSIRKKTAYNSSDTLFVIGGLGSGFGEVGQADRLEFKQVSFTGVPRWDISNFVGSTYQTNLTFSGQNIGVKKTNPAYNLDINGTFRAVGNSVFDGNVGIGTSNPVSKIHINSATVDNINLTIGHANGGTVLGHTIANEGVMAGYSATNLKFGHSTSSSFVETVRFNADGNVGIGTSLPNYQVHAKSVNASYFAESTDGTAGIRINAQSGVTLIETTTNTDLKIRTNSIERMSVGANGNVGIGTISPEQKLHVEGLMKLKSYTTTEINSFTGMTLGTITINSTIGLPIFWNGTAWKRFDGTNM